MSMDLTFWGLRVPELSFPQKSTYMCVILVIVKQMQPIYGFSAPSFSLSMRASSLFFPVADSLGYLQRRIAFFFSQVCVFVLFI